MLQTLKVLWGQHITYQVRTSANCCWLVSSVSWAAKLVILLALQFDYSEYSTGVISDSRDNEDTGSAGSGENRTGVRKRKAKACRARIFLRLTELRVYFHHIRVGDYWNSENTL